MACWSGAEGRAAALSAVVLAALVGLPRSGGQGPAAAPAAPEGAHAEGPGTGPAGALVPAESGQLDSAARARTLHHWRARLLDSDLDRREASLGQLVEALRRNPSLIGLVRSWARDPEQGELAWTARMALRELARPPLFGFHGHLTAPGPGPTAPAIGGEPTVVGADFRGPKVHIQHVPNGVVVRVEGLVDGQRRELSFGASSLPQLVARHPGLERLLPRPGAVAGDPSLDLAVGSRGPRDPFAVGPPLGTDVLGVAVRPSTADERRRLGIDGAGLFVLRVADDTIGSVLDLRPGSVLIEVNGERLVDEQALSRIVADRPSTGALRITLFDPLERLSVRTWRPAPSRR